MTPISASLPRNVVVTPVYDRTELVNQVIDTKTGQPVSTISPSRRVISREWKVFLPKSWAGSMMIRSRATPAETAREWRDMISAKSASSTASRRGSGFSQGAHRGRKAQDGDR